MRFKRKLIGIGLIEVLISVAMIAICILALTRFQSGIAYSDLMSRQQSEATILATNKLESLREYQVIAVTAGYAAYASILTGTSNVVGSNATYTLSWTVTSYTNPTYKTVDLTVSWPDSRGSSQNVKLSTRIAGLDPSLSGAII